MDIEYENLIVNRLKDYIYKISFNLISVIQKKVKKDNIHNTMADRNKLVCYALPIIENYFFNNYEYYNDIAGVEVICDESLNPPSQIEKGLIKMEARVYAKYKGFEFPVQIFLEDFKENR